MFGSNITAYVTAKTIQLTNVVFGEESTTQVSLDWIKDTKDNTFNSLDNKLKGIGSSAYSTLMLLAALVAVLAIVCIGISLIVNKNANKRDESKQWLLWIVLGIILMFGAFAIVGYAATIGGAL